MARRGASMQQRRVAERPVATLEATVRSVDKRGSARRSHRPARVAWRRRFANKRKAVHALRARRTCRRGVPLALDVWNGPPPLLQRMQRTGHVEQAAAVPVHSQLLRRAREGSENKVAAVPRSAKSEGHVEQAAAVAVHSKLCGARGPRRAMAGKGAKPPTCQRTAEHGANQR